MDTLLNSRQITPDAEVDQWVEEAGLNWEAQLRPLFIPVNRDIDDDPAEPKLLEVPGRFVVVRSDTQRPFFVGVSNRYRPHQPREILSFFRKMVDATHGAFKMESIGMLNDGAKIVGIATADDALDLDGDVLRRHLIMATSFDLSCPTIGKQSSFRLFCSNQLDSFLRGGPGQVRIKHITSFNPDAVVKQMRLDEQWSRFSDYVSRFASEQVTEREERQFFLDAFYPNRNAKDFSQKAAERRVDNMIALARRGPGSSHSGSQNTLWGALNAVTHYVDHECRSRTPDMRADKALFGDGAVLKQRALQLAVSRVSAAENN